MLEMAMVEMGMELAKATGEELRSNQSPSPLRRWLPSLIILTCRMMMMMMNPQRRRKVPPTSQMLI
jgi:hypothetical protein